MTYDWLNEAARKVPVIACESAFNWATRAERLKVITFKQAYLLRTDYRWHCLAFHAFPVSDKVHNESRQS